MNNQALLLVVTILNRGQGERLACILSDMNVHANVVLLGHGTAKKTILSYLGLGETEKDVVLSKVPGQLGNRVVEEITRYFQLSKPGKGIVFSVPVNFMVCTVKKDHTTKVSQYQGGTEMKPTTHNLIVAILNRGYADDVMDQAREAGASGGTVLRGHSAGLKQAEKFLGITIQPEREVIMILAREEDCPPIMSSIAEHHGIGHEACALVFSLPINHIEGLTPLIKP